MDNQPSHIEPIINIKNLKKSYGENHVLNGFNMHLNEGENLVIMGKSGSGKSVMIKCLIGLERPDEGTIEIMGRDISTLDRTALDELRTEIGFLFQGSALYDSMTVRENLEFPLRRHTKKFGVLKDTTPLVMEALEKINANIEALEGRVDATDEAFHAFRNEPAAGKITNNLNDSQKNQGELADARWQKIVEYRNQTSK